MNRDLFLAILAMDSYNRGYGEGLDGLSSRNGTQIGNATIRADSSVLTIDNVRQDIAAGFYGIAYDVSGVAGFADGERVIAYRGTNFAFNNPSDFLNSPAVLDAANGWIVGAGSPSGQANLALDFYNAVVGEDGDRFDSNITLTGHSLGGGLAGYVASLYGQRGTLFDNMTFELAVTRAYGRSVTGEDLILRQRIYNDGLTSGLLVAPDPSGLNAFAVTGEVLSVLVGRLSQTPQVIGLDSNGGLRNPLSLHSAGLLVNLLWARDNVSSDWQNVAPLLWDAYFNSDVANALPSAAARASSENDALDTLNTAIAYSAIEGGDDESRPFGNVAIRSMFDDANDLGGVVNNTATIARSARYLSQILVQFAGKLAFGDVEGGSTSEYASGILTINPGTLTLDLTDARWRAGDQNGRHNTIVGREELISIALSDIDVEVIQTGPTSPGAPPAAPIVNLRSDLLSGLRWLFGGATDPLELIERVIFRTDDESFSGTLEAGPSNGGSGNGGAGPDLLTLFVSGGGNDDIRGSAGADFIHGGNGVDILRGGAGDDILAGGDGDDILSGGAGRNVIAGGQGNDVYDLRFNGFANGVGLGIQYLAPSGDDDKEALIVASREIGGAATSEDLLLDVEEIRLSDNADHILTSGINLGDYGALTVNAGGFSGEVTGADFDTVSFNTRNNPLLGTEGIFWRNGGTQGALPNLDLANLGASAEQLIALGFVPAVAALLAVSGARIGGLLANLTGLSFGIEDATRSDDDLTVTGIENVNLTDEDDSFAFTARDYSIHSGFGTINAGGGEDVILFRDARYFNAGEYLDSADQLLADERAAAEARGVEYTGRDPDPDAPIATEILRLTVNGGDGEDRIFIRGGTGAIAVGGAGRDVLYNSSRGGELYGDGLAASAANDNVAMGREMVA